MSKPPATSRSNPVGDLIAGLISGVANIPDAMATAYAAAQRWQRAQPLAPMEQLL